MNYYLYYFNVLQSCASDTNLCKQRVFEHFLSIPLLFRGFYVCIYIGTLRFIYNLNHDFPSCTGIRIISILVLEMAMMIEVCIVFRLYFGILISQTTVRNAKHHDNNCNRSF